MFKSLLHHSDIGGRHRHAAIVAADLPLCPAADVVHGAGLMVPERISGSSVALRHLRGLGGAAKLKFCASTGALRREIDHYSFPASDLSCGHFDDPFDLRLSVTRNPSDRRISGAKEPFAVGGSDE